MRAANLFDAPHMVIFPALACDRRSAFIAGGRRDGSTRRTRSQMAALESSK